jgi:preprotein translocase subunit SecE
MADKFDRPETPATPSGPKKAAGPKIAANGKPTAAPANSALAQAQRRAQTMASRPTTSPTQFFEEAWVELKKTSWPDRDVLTKSTSVVLALVVAVAIWVGGIDALLNHFTGALFKARH